MRAFRNSLRCLPVSQTILSNGLAAPSRPGLATSEPNITPHRLAMPRTTATLSFARGEPL